MSEQTAVRTADTRLAHDESWPQPVPVRGHDRWLWVHLLSLLAGWLAVWLLLRGTWFRSDDFEFLANRVLAEPTWTIWAGHNEHWSTGPVLIWQLLYDRFGMRSAAPYLAVSLLAHVLTAHFIWRLMRRSDVRPGVATGLAASFVVLGAGGENITWAFQLGFMGSSALGLAAVLLCLRGGRVAYAAALCTALVSLTFSGVSIPFVVAAAAALALRRQWLRAVGMAASCGSVFAVWYLTVGQLSQGPDHPTDRLQRAGNAAEWAWTLLGNAAGRYVSYTGAGAVLVIGLGLFAVVVARREGAVLARPTTDPARERFVPIMVTTGTALLQAAVFTAGRVDISLPDIPRYHYFLIALLLPLFGVALSRAVVPLGRTLIAGVLAYLVVTQGLLLVARERELENPQIQADVLGVAGLISTGEPVRDIKLVEHLTTRAISAWVDEGTLGNLDTVSDQAVRDGRALAQVATGDSRPAGTSAGTVTEAVAGSAVAAGACESVSAQPGQVAATLQLSPGQTVSVRLDDPGALVYRVVDVGGTSRPIGVPVPVNGTRWVTTSTALTLDVVADTGQTLTFCRP